MSITEVGAAFGFTTSSPSGAFVFEHVFAGRGDEQQALSLPVDLQVSVGSTGISFEDDAAVFARADADDSARAVAALPFYSSVSRAAGLADLG